MTNNMKDTEFNQKVEEYFNRRIKNLEVNKMKLN